MIISSIVIGFIITIIAIWPISKSGKALMLKEAEESGNIEAIRMADAISGMKWVTFAMFHEFYMPNLRYIIRRGDAEEVLRRSKTRQAAMDWTVDKFQRKEVTKRQKL